MLHIDFQGVTYISMPSSGGHLRASGKYADGWFFGHAGVEVHGSGVNFQIEELKPPHGQGRITKPSDWGMLGLLEKVGQARRPTPQDYYPRRPSLARYRCFSPTPPPSPYSP